MPKPRRPHVASPDEVHFTRNGDFLVVEYDESRIATPQLKVGAENLAAVKDEGLLDYWNDLQRANEDSRKAFKYVAREIPPAARPRSSPSSAASQPRRRRWPPSGGRSSWGGAWCGGRERAGLAV